MKRERVSRIGGTEEGRVGEREKWKEELNGMRKGKGREGGGGESED